jgi:hypothetical protein
MKKFRVWSKSLNKYFAVDFIKALKLTNEGYFSFPKSNDFIEQQFTGLIDTKGREVYEGDRVRVSQNPLYTKKGSLFNAGEVIKYQDIFEGIVVYHHGSYQVMELCPQSSPHKKRMATLSNFWVGGDFNTIEII